MIENPLPNVGVKLRFLRDQQGLSLRALGELSGLSFNAISQIEHNENSPTVSTLYRLATALNVPITDFFYEEEKLTTVFVKRGQGLSSIGEGMLMESLGIGLNDQHLEPFRMTLKPGIVYLEDPISHPGEEFIYCLDGELTYYVGDQTFHLAQGDSLLFDATRMHSYINKSHRPTTFLIVFEAPQNRQLAQQLHMEY